MSKTFCTKESAGLHNMCFLSTKQSTWKTKGQMPVQRSSIRKLAWHYWEFSSVLSWEVISRIRHKARLPLLGDGLFMCQWYSWKNAGLVWYWRWSFILRGRGPISGQSVYADVSKLSSQWKRAEVSGLAKSSTWDLGKLLPVRWTNDGGGQNVGAILFCFFIWRLLGKGFFGPSALYQVPKNFG